MATLPPINLQKKKFKPIQIKVSLAPEIAELLHLFALEASEKSPTPTTIGKENDIIDPAWMLDAGLRNSNTINLKGRPSFRSLSVFISKIKLGQLSSKKT